MRVETQLQQEQRPVHLLARCGETSDDLSALQGHKTLLDTLTSWVNFHCCGLWGKLYAFQLSIGLVIAACLKVTLVIVSNWFVIATILADLPRVGKICFLLRVRVGLAGKLQPEAAKLSQMV